LARRRAVKWRQKFKPVLFTPLPELTAVDMRVFEECERDVARVLDIEIHPEPSDNYYQRLHEEMWNVLAPSFNLTRQERRDRNDRQQRLLERHPEALGPLIRAAVYDPDPSHNKIFVLPTTRAFGSRRVRAEILRYLQTGPNAERAGAARAWYWTPSTHQVVRTQSGDIEFRDVPDESADVAAEWNEATLREFLANEDLDVRRSLIAGLELRKTDANRDLHDLVDSAISVARSHPDEYIRHRLQGKLRT
jgi:hypothetical protein